MPPLLWQDPAWGGPEHSAYQQLGHGFFYLFSLYIIDNQTETVTKIYEGGGDPRAFL